MIKVIFKNNLLTQVSILSLLLAFTFTSVEGTYKDKLIFSDQKSCLLQSSDIKKM